MIKVTFSTEYTEFKLEFNDMHEALSFIEGYIMWNEGRPRLAKYSVDLEEIKNDN